MGIPLSSGQQHVLGGPVDHARALQNLIQRSAHEVTLKDGLVLMDGAKARLRMGPRSITIGCTEITPEAARFIIREWEKRFAHQLGEVILQ